MKTVSGSLKKTKWLIVIFGTLVATGCPNRALSLDIVPPIDGLDIASSATHPKYQDAVRNAQRAFWIQSGIKSQYDLVRDAVHRKTSALESSAIDKTLNLMDQFIPINREYVLFTAGGVYTILVKKSYHHSFASPLCRSLNHYIKWSPETTETGVTFHF